MYYSPETKGFYSDEVNTVIPSDAVEISKEYWLELLIGQQDGKLITSDSSGSPILSDHAPLTNSQLLTTALNDLALSYKNDSFDLNMAYVAAITNDGSSEAGKVTSVRSQITSRKAQYISDMAAAKAQYPLE